MFGRLLTRLRTALDRDGAADHPRQAGPGGGEPGGGARVDEQAPGFVVCEGCDTTYIATGMASCPRCGGPVLPVREADYDRESFV